MTIDIILISYNTQTLLLKCLNSIRHAPQGCEIGKIIIVDNASDDLTIENVRENFPDVHVIALTENKGYAHAVNIGVQHAESEWVFVGNSDIEFRPNSLLNLLQGAQSHDNVGIACPQQVYPDNSRQRSWGFFPGYSEALHYITFSSAIENLLESISMKLGISRSSRFIPYADGAALLINRSAFTTIGGFDDSFFFFGEEADFCQRMWQSGKGVLFVPSSTIMHVRGATYGGNSPSLKSLKMLIDSKQKFIMKHSPNASLSFIMFLMGIYHALMVIVFLPFGVFSKRHRSKISMNSMLAGLYLLSVKSTSITGGIK
jgi:GT2 family glycosyltransferase